jgi:sensor histidine kinase YesM
MRNFFASNSKYRFTYWFIWGIVTVTYAIALNFLLHLSWVQASAEALVFDILFAMMGVAAWYVVRFSGLDSARVLNTIVSHLVAGAVLVLATIVIGEAVLGVFYPDDELYKFNSEYHVYRIIVGGIFYIFLTINFYLVVYYEEYRSRKIHQIEMDKHLKSAELNMLKAQINPHFIFNSLNSISSLTLTDASKAHDMVIQLADFLRYSIRKDADQLVCLKQEIEAIELFLNIEKIRFGERLKVDVTCDENLLDNLLPALILQPIVENAIKYSLHESDLNSNISIHCTSQAGMLQLIITNNYDIVAVPKKGEGIGLENVNNRLALIYGRKDLLKTSVLDDLFSVEIIIPQA